MLITKVDVFKFAALWLSCAVVALSACSPQGVTVQTVVSPTREATQTGSAPSSPTATTTAKATAAATDTPLATETVGMGPSDTPVPSDTVSATPTVPATATTATPVQAGDVWLTTDKDAYRRGEAIVATAGNDLPVAIEAQTGNTYCTLFSVEQRVDGGWEMRGPCLQGAPPGLVRIPAGGRISVEVRPQGDYDAILEPGEYRVTFAYREVQRDASSGPGPWQTTTSEEFSIVD